MAITYKGAVVEKVVHHKTKREGVVRLDKGHMMFYARAVDTDVHTPSFADKDGTKVRAWLLGELGRTSEKDRLDWLPVVTVKIGGNRHGRYFRDDDEEYGHAIDLTFKRFYIALTLDGREWRELPWRACQPRSTGHVPPNDRYGESSRFASGPKSTEAERQAAGFHGQRVFRLPSYAERSGGDGEATLAYTEGLWTALQAIDAQLHAARKTLGAMIGDTEGVAFLTEIGEGKKPFLLMKPKEEGSDDA